MIQDSIVTDEEVHPLLQVETDFATSWSEWKQLWNTRLPAIVRHGLLHYGFQVKADTTEEYGERLLFYLNAADGHCHAWAFRKFNERQEEMRTPFNTTHRMTAQDVYRVLAEKAFVELGRNVFKNTERRGETPSWYDDVFRIPGIFEKVLWFFRPSEKDWWLRNLGHDWKEAPTSYQVAADFLFEICILGFNSGLLRSYDREVRLKLAESQPLLVEILSGLKRLDYLLGIEGKISPACLTQLEKIAMRRDFWLPTQEQRWQNHHRKPATLEEAIYANSEAARILMALRIKNAQKERFAQLYELASRQRTTQAQMEKLTSQ